MAKPTGQGFEWKALAAVVAPSVVAGMLAAVAFDDDYRARDEWDAPPTRRPRATRGR